MSYVASLFIDGDVIYNPSWDDVEHAIASLNGDDQTLVTLAPPPPEGVPVGDHHFTIGGGGDDRCLVEMTTDNVTFWNLEDVSKAGLPQPFYMVVGGQVDDFRESQCVPRAWALTAARAYFDHGGRAPDLPWREH